MSVREQIAEQALALPAEDRLYLADRLEQSLSQGDFATPEIATAWLEEIERRLAACDRGEVQAAGVDDALGRIRAQLATHRSGRLGS